jgi:hypothetical protein
MGLLPFLCAEGILARVIVSRQECNALKDVMLSVVCLPLQRQVDIGKTNAEIDHRIFWIEGVCSEEII